MHGSSTLKPENPTPASKEGTPSLTCLCMNERIAKQLLSHRTHLGCNVILPCTNVCAPVDSWHFTGAMPVLQNSNKIIESKPLAFFLLSFSSFFFFYMLRVKSCLIYFGIDFSGLFTSRKQDLGLKRDILSAAY